MEKQWTILEALTWTQQRFERSGEENPRLAAQMLAAHATGLTRIDLYAQFDKPLSEQERTVLRESIQRRLEGEPLQYLIGSTGFRYLELKVRPPVLIPRPETETLVELVIAHVKSHCSHNEHALSHPEQPLSHPEQPPCHPEQPLCHPEQPLCHPERSEGSFENTLTILDIGTGTGAIALSLLHELSEVQVTATDIDEAALQLAQQNATELGLDDTGRLHLLTDDFATSLVEDNSRHQSFDVVVSNPPYIPTEEYEALPKEILHYESRRALDGGAEGLDAFSVIAQQALCLLKPGGLLAVELHETALEQAAAFLKDQSFKEVKIHPDLTSRQRFVTALRR